MRRKISGLTIEEFGRFTVAGTDDGSRMLDPASAPLVPEGGIKAAVAWSEKEKALAAVALTGEGSPESTIRLLFAALE